MRFALLGAGGYIAPRHMRAIAETGNDLIVAYDVNDSVGILDSHFPDAQFFTEFEQYDRFIARSAAAGCAIDYVAVASPNYLHLAHISHALRSGADVICEKPLVLEPEQIDELAELEAETGRRVSTILQLRLHPAIASLKQAASRAGSDTKRDVELTYITSRGNWYLKSWKADAAKSGGIATNIGVHFFDMLHHLFGASQENVVHLAEPTRSAGYLELEHARVRWFMSLEVADVPDKWRAKGQRTYRSIKLDGQEIEFSGGFTDLHNLSYEQILAGKGFRPVESRAAIETVASIRRSQPTAGADRHPFLRS